MCTKINSCDFDITKRICTFSCGEIEEGKCRARRDHYKRENTYEKDVLNLKKEISKRNTQIDISNILMAEKTILHTLNESLQSHLDSLIEAKETLISQLDAFHSDEDMLRWELQHIADCKKSHIAEQKNLIADKEAFIAKLKKFIADKKELIAELETLITESKI